MKGRSGFMRPHFRCSLRAVLAVTVLASCMCGPGWLGDRSFAGDQRITASPHAQVVVPGSPVSFSVFYSTADPVDETLTGLGLRLHYDSRKVRFVTLANRFDRNLVAQGNPQADRRNFDGDPSTDVFINVAWADPFSASWPGAGATPLLLYTATFQTTADFTGETRVNFSATSTAVGYRLAAQSVVLTSTIPDAGDPTPEGGERDTREGTGSGGEAGSENNESAADGGRRVRGGARRTFPSGEGRSAAPDSQGGAEGSASAGADASCQGENCGEEVRVQTSILTISAAGDGIGSVTVSPSGLRCTTVCSQSFERGEEITMVATPAPGSVFAGWEGDAGCSDRPFTLESSRNCVARFEKETRKLGIARVGGGSAKVTSSPPGIECGLACSALFPVGAVVHLVAPDDSPASFIGWTGDPDCRDGRVEMEDDRECIANFAETDSNLNLLLVGTGSGTVRSMPSGIDCGRDCSHGFRAGMSVKLEALPDENSVFTGWSGHADCADGSITISDTKTCRASFARKRFALTVSRAGEGSGLILSNPAGIECGERCTHEFEFGTTVELETVPDHGAVFDSWKGGADCTEGAVLMDRARSCSAAFDLAPRGNFLCYATHSTKRVGRKVAVADGSIRTEVEVRDGVSLCNPVTEKGDEITNEGVHLQGYRIRVPRAERRRKNISMKVENRFGKFAIDARRASRLLVPAVRAEFTTTPRQVNDLGEYKCYSVRGSGPEKEFSKHLDAIVKRSSAPEIRLRLRGLTRICNRVHAREDGAGDTDNDQRLLCFRVGRVQGIARASLTDIHVRNQFGSTRVKQRKAEEFCVSSRVVQ